MTLKNLITRCEEVAQQIDAIDSDFDQANPSAKDGLTKLQSILCQIAVKDRKLLDKVVEARMKKEE